jgi:hypothetical protein
MFMQNLRADEPEKLFMKAYPRLLITKFVGQSDGEVYWCWKWPLFGVTKEAYKSQEISSIILERDGSTKRLIYDQDFRLIRREIKTGPNQWAEQVAAARPASTP